MTIRTAIPIFVAFLLFSLSSNNQYWTDFQAYLADHEQTDLESGIKQVISTLQNSSNGFAFTDFLGGGSYGGVLKATNSAISSQPVAVKIMPVKHSKECEFNEIINKVNVRGVKYLIKSFKRQEISSYTNSGKSQLFCVLTLEAGLYSLRGAFLRKVPTGTDATALMRKIIIQFLEGIYTLNFVAGYLHGDLKPENTILITNDDGELEIRIIDLDLTIKPSKEKSKYGTRNTGNTLYTQGFRPPEMEVLCPGMDCFNLDKDDKFTQRADYFARFYNLDLSFKEDSWSAAQTLTKILSDNSLHITSTDSFLRYIERDVLPNMLNADIEKRWTTKQAFEAAKVKYVPAGQPSTKVGHVKVDGGQPALMQRDEQILARDFKNLPFAKGRLDDIDFQKKVQEQLKHQPLKEVAVGERFDHQRLAHFRVPSSHEVKQNIGYEQPPTREFGIKRSYSFKPTSYNNAEVFRNDPPRVLVPQHNYYGNALYQENQVNNPYGGLYRYKRLI